MPEVDLEAITRGAALTTPRDERGCPSADELAAFATDELTRDRREAILDHLELCPDCALEASAGTEVSRLVEERLPGAGRETGRPSAPRRPHAPRRWLAWAASVVLALSALLVYRGLDEPVDEFRSGESAAWRSEPADGATLAEAPRALAWTAPVEAKRFRVTLYDATFSPLASSGELAAPRFELSPELALPRGKTYFWRVEVVGVAGRDGARTFSFELAP